MKKKIILIFIIILSNILYCFEEIDLDMLLLSAFGSELKIGLNSIRNDKVYFKVNEGRMKVKAGENEIIIEKDGEIEVFESKGKVSYNGELYDKVELEKLDVITVTGVSKTNNKYRNYRGKFDIIVEKNKIIPINIITAEEYLYSVVPSEIGNKFPDEAIKAQAVAARTYLYYGLKTKNMKIMT